MHCEYSERIKKDDVFVLTMLVDGKNRSGMTGKLKTSVASELIGCAEETDVDTTSGASPLKFIDWGDRNSTDPAMGSYHILASALY